ncbi:MarR family winged helix-turn-helix transcriptional regulator [Nocardioides sp. DS6]|uniref:MarR family winged helix-turn-helix transcriptional regulator n=1 Tax=Nocardioides eburneus TaxID=3231482 RepID=A0ABV3T2T2_9ACTN
MEREWQRDEIEEIIADWAREQPATDVSSSRVVVPLRRLAERLDAARTETLAEHGLDQGSLDVLDTLRRAGRPYRLTAGELTRRCRVTAGATTQRVVRLENAGLVRRVREQPDRRTVHVELTPRGSQRLDEAFADVVAADERVLAPLSGTDRKDLERTLRAWLRGARPLSEALG